MRHRSTFWLAVLLVLCISLPAFAAMYGHVMDDVTDSHGVALQGVTIYVYDIDTHNEVLIYSDLAGTTLGQPISTDSGGWFDFYVLPGLYDLNLTHDGYNVSETWEDYIVPGYAVGSATCADTLKSCSDDTVHVRGSDGGREGVLKTNQLVLEGAYGHGAADRAAIRFGPYAEGTENIHARVYLPYYGVFWMTRPGYSARVPKYDPGNASFGSHNMLGIGGTTGRTTNWQFWEDVFMAWAVADAESTASDTLNTRYNDRTVFGFGRKTTDAAYSGVDTMFCDAYQSFNITNTRSDSTSWCWTKPGLQGTFPNPVGDRGGPYGAPDYGIKLETDLPDSNGASAYRDAVVIRWWMTPASRNIWNPASSFLTMYEHDTVNYAFRHDYFEMKVGKGGTVNKGLRWHSSDSATYTKMRVADNESGFLVYTANGFFNIFDDDGSDDATLDCANIQATAMFKLPVFSLATSWPADIGPGSMFMSEGDTVYVRNQADNAYYALN